MFTPLSKIIPRAAAQLGIKREIEAALICEKYRKLAPRLVHTNALKHTFPKFYRNKTLTIAVENPAWAQQVMNCKSALLQAINESLGKKSVEMLKTQVVEKI
jgi:predicted nucleic acid-binding Zn ribbon protein